VILRPWVDEADDGETRPGVRASNPQKGQAIVIAMGRSLALKIKFKEGVGFGRSVGFNSEPDDHGGS